MDFTSDGATALISTGAILISGFLFYAIASRMKFFAIPRRDQEVCDAADKLTADGGDDFVPFPFLRENLAWASRNEDRPAVDTPDDTARLAALIAHHGVIAKPEIPDKHTASIFGCAGCGFTGPSRISHGRHVAELHVYNQIADRRVAAQLMGGGLG